MRFGITTVALCAAISCSHARPRSMSDFIEETAQWMDDNHKYGSDPEPAFAHDAELPLTRRSRIMPRLRKYKRIGPLTSSNDINSSSNGAKVGANSSSDVNNRPTDSSSSMGAGSVSSGSPDTGSTSGYSPGYVGTFSPAEPEHPNCSDPNMRYNACWDILNITGYILDWQNSHYCSPGVGFSDCFLSNNGAGEMDCSGISVSTCVPRQMTNIDIRAAYVITNIVQINNFFNTWYTAVKASAVPAAANIGEIVQILDPPKQFTIGLNIVLVALQTLFAFLPAAAGLAAINRQSTQGFQQIAQAVTNGINVTPNLGRFLFPIDTANSQQIQVALMGHKFSGILLNVENNLAATCRAVMGNSTYFLAFAENGNFSTGVQSLPQDVNYMYSAFNTWLISKTLEGNGIRAVVALDTNPQQLATNGTKLNYKIDCKSYNDVGVCDTWWYSKNFKAAFTLDHFKHMNRNYNKELTQLFREFTSGELLFENALACNRLGYYGQTANITLDYGGIETACLSQLKVLTWDMACHSVAEYDDKSGRIPQQYLDSKCEFVEEPAQQTFFFSGPPSDTSGLYSVPAGYLGPAIAQQKFQLTRS